MTLEQAIETVRITLGDRADHHPKCNSRLNDHLSYNLPCDCYAASRQVPHKAMDVIENFIRERRINETH